MANSAGPQPAKAARSTHTPNKQPGITLTTLSIVLLTLYKIVVDHDGRKRRLVLAEYLAITLSQQSQPGSQVNRVGDKGNRAIAARRLYAARVTTASRLIGAIGWIGRQAAQVAIGGID